MQSILIPLLALFAAALRLQGDPTTYVMLTITTYDAAGNPRVLTRPTVFAPSGKTAHTEYTETPVPPVPREGLRASPMFGWALTPTLLDDGRHQIHVVITELTKGGKTEVVLDSTVTARMLQEATVRIGDWEFSVRPLSGKP